MSDLGCISVGQQRVSHLNTGYIHDKRAQTAGYGKAQVVILRSICRTPYTLFSRFGSTYLTLSDSFPCWCTVAFEARARVAWCNVHGLG